MRLLYILVSIIVCLMIVLAFMIFNIPKYIELEITELTTIPTTVPETSIPETEITETTVHTEPTEIVETTEPTEATLPYSEEELEMLACVIYQEAGGDYYCDECRRRVADVVLNRIADERYPDTMYEVLTQRSQYGRFHWTGIVWPGRASDITEQHAVERAYRIAEEILLGYHSNLYGQGYIYQAEFKQGRDNIYCCGHYYGR